AASDQEQGRNDQHQDRARDAPPIGHPDFPLFLDRCRVGGGHRFGCHLVHWFEALFKALFRQAFSRACASTFLVISMSRGSIPANVSAIISSATALSFAMSGCACAVTWRRHARRSAGSER